MKLKFVSFDDMYDEKCVVNNHEGIDSKTKKFNADGIFSESIFGKLDNESVAFTCSCGKKKGKFYEGTSCEECNSDVVFTEPMVNRRAWILLNDFYILNPNFYKFLTKICKKTTLNNIIAYQGKLDKDGVIVDSETDDCPYNNIGLVEFRERFDEILDYFHKTSNSKIKDSIYNLIKKNKEHVFINKVPVYSTTLRPALMMKEKLIFDEVNNTYNSIILNSNIIKEVNQIESEDGKLTIYPLMYNIQLQANQVFEKIVDNIKGKSGFIRNNMMGSRVNFSARTVITPLPSGYGIDSIVVPYLAFMELYKFQILNILSRVKGISIGEANTIWNKGTTTFSQELYDIMKEIIKKVDCKVLLNRPPTISYGSILCLTIVDIKHDYDDLTSSIHNCILDLLAGDYDGDVLSIFPLIDESLKRTFSKSFSPRNMLISSDNGMFNGRLNIDRDQALGIYSFNC